MIEGLIVFGATGRFLMPAVAPCLERPMWIGRQPSSVSAWPVSSANTRAKLLALHSNEAHSLPCRPTKPEIHIRDRVDQSLSMETT